MRCVGDQVSVGDLVRCVGDQVRVSDQVRVCR